MLSQIDKFLLRAFLRSSCPDSIPRSGEKGKRIRCYVIYLKTASGELLLLVKELRDNGIFGTSWNGALFDKSKLIPFTELKGVQFEVERYLGLWSFTYSSILQCTLHDWTGLNRYPIAREAISQFFFSRKDLGLTDRIQALQALVQKSIEDSNFKVNAVSLPALLHGHRWILHPDKERQMAYARLMLESFQKSGELLKGSDDMYRISGKALTSLSQYEAERQRHDQIVSQSRHMKWLTLALIIVGVAGVVASYMGRGAT